MSSYRNIDATIRQYLLGQLTGDGLEQFEQQLFADDNLFEEVLIAEDELIDESLAGELNQAESELFARNFPNTRDRKQKLLFRRALKGYGERKKPRQEAARRWSFLPAAVHSFRTAITAAALIIVAALVALWPFTPPPPTFAVINLSISPSERAPGAQTPKIKLPLNVDELKLQLALPETAMAAQSYRVELERVNGQPRTLKIDPQVDKSVVVTISASQLEPGRYALNLYVTKPGEPEQRIAGSYYFTAE
jgi:hypothetical protein